MASQNTWQLSWNHKNYDFKKRMQIVLENESNRTIMQSWGRGPITNIKKIAAGDIVYISCKKKCIMKGVVRKQFATYSNITPDECIKNPSVFEERHRVGLWCEIYITDVYPESEQRELRGNQNTFCNPRNAFWKN
jgi:hypothetical protein